MEFQNSTLRSLIELKSAQRFDDEGNEIPGWETNPKTLEIETETQAVINKVIQLIKSLRMISCIVLLDMEDWDNYRRINLEKAARDFDLQHVEEITLADIPDSLPIGQIDQQIRALDLFLDHASSQVHEIELTHFENVDTLTPTFIKHGFHFNKMTIIDNRTTLRITRHIGHWDSRNPNNTYGWSRWNDN